MKWRLETRKIKDLRTYGKNARRLSSHDAAHLEKSLEKFGQCEPIVVNTDNTIIGGHQRLRTLHKMKHKEVDVYVPDAPLNEKEVEELNIRLNRNVGEWDWDMLANDWDEMDLAEYGFTDSELCLQQDDEVLDDVKEDVPSNWSMSVTFATPEDLNDAEPLIAAIVKKYKGAKCKLKVK